MKSIMYYTMVFISFLFCGCSQLTCLQKTMWINASPVNEQDSALLLTSLEFQSDKNIEIYNAVVDDKDVLVTAFKFADGTYSLTKNKKNTVINISASTIDGNSIDYRGVCHKNKAIVLEYDNKSVKTFGKSSIKLP